MRRFLHAISMNCKLALALVALVLTSSLSVNAASAANSTAKPAPPASFAGWSSTGGDQSVAPASDPRWPALWPVLREYGYESGALQQYSKDDKSLSVALYRMKDPSGAYGLYSFLRSPGMTHASITEHSCVSNARALILDGSTVLEILGGKNLNVAGLERDFKSLVDSLGAPPADTQYPALFSRLPLRGFQQGTDRYVLGPAALQSAAPIAEGDWVGFANGAEAETAQYRFSGNANHTVNLIVIDYPTPQVAAKMLREWESKFNLNAQESGSQKPVVYASRKLTIVGVVAGATDATEAKALLEHLSPGQELTWNEPSFAVDQSNINNVIASVIVGTGILCMFTLVAGLAFGGVRLVIKRILPGRVFDRGTAMDVLQLGLASKPINSDDFYGMRGSASRAPVSPKI